MRLLLLISVVTWCVTLASGNVQGEKIVKAERNLSQAFQTVIHSANTFSPNFLTAIAKSVSGNFVCSPISASLLLSMVTFGAQGNTEKQLRRVLALPEDDHDLAKIGFHALIDSFNNYPIADLRLANRIYLAEGLEPEATFINVTKTAFRSEVQNVNFTNQFLASRTINTWVEDQTKNLIKDLTSPENFNSDTKLVLVSAIYFKAIWGEQFDSLKTKNESFYVDNNTKKNVPMMHQVGNHQYGVFPELNATFLKLPYMSDWSNDSMSMFIILPDEIEGLAKVENNFDKVTVDELLRRCNNYKVSVTLPKFKIESTIELDEPFKQMGLTDMFSDEANFNGITKSHSLKVTKVVQKAFIEINESGTEAAGANWMGLSNRQGGSTRSVNFVANHRFIIIIATTGTNPVILFAARYNGPNNTE